MAVALCLAHRGIVIVAFLLAGLGVCTIFPIAFGFAGRARSGAPGQSLAAVATMGYSAGLIGPAAIAFVAGGSSLRVALWLLVLAGAVSAALAGHLREPSGASGRPLVSE
jgi:hypothetical protein